MLWDIVFNFLYIIYVNNYEDTDNANYIKYVIIATQRDEEHMT